MQNHFVTIRANVVLLIQSCIAFVLARRARFSALASVVLFLACLSRYWVSYDPAGSVPREPESFRVAHSLYEKGTFANPFVALDTGVSAHLAPVFPAFLALLLEIFGGNSVGIYAIQLTEVLVLSVQLALYPVFSRRLGMGEISGIIGASFWILAKPRTAYLWESSYAAILVAVACCWYRRYLDANARERHALRWSLGFLMGLLILMLPTAVPVYAAWLAWELWRRKSTFFKESLLALVLLPAMMIAPWTIRNYRVLQDVILIRDNIGLELSVSNNDCAEFGIQANIRTGCFEKVHPNRNVNEAGKVVELGEVNYNKLQLHAAVNWIGRHPVTFIKLSLMRFVAFWMPTDTFTIHYASSQTPLERPTIYFMTLLSWPGLVMLYRRDKASAALLCSFLAIFPVTYYFVQFEYRYRYPILWITFLLGAAAITTYAERSWDRFKVKAAENPRGR
jgi:hypothetical protein